jgi:hypothetical protein
MRRLSKWGVIPYRFLKGGGLEVLLITTKSKKWGLPKGNMIRKLGPSRTALVEAYEEAGIGGKVSKKMIQCMHKNTCLYLYPMLVTKVYSSWPEIVRGHQDHWSQGTKKDFEAIRPCGIIEVNLAI